MIWDISLVSYLSFRFFLSQILVANLPFKSPKQDCIVFITISHKYHLSAYQTKNRNSKSPSSQEPTHHPLCRIGYCNSNGAAHSPSQPIYCQMGITTIFNNHHHQWGLNIHESIRTRDFSSFCYGMFLCFDSFSSIVQSSVEQWSYQFTNGRGATRGPNALIVIHPILICIVSIGFGGFTVTGCISTQCIKCWLRVVVAV